MDKEILQVLEYYSFFHYAPTIYEVWKFLATPRQLRQLTMGKQIIVKNDRVALINNRRWIAESIKREKISKEKISKMTTIIKFLGTLPWVKFIGISGSVAAMNAEEKDDIDLFVITSKNRLWTARFFLTVISILMGKRRGRNDQQFKDKLCFNLFFTEDSLSISKNKQNIYVGHEVLQVMSVVDKEGTYRKFLEANRWVERLFPNVNLKFKISNSKSISNSKFQILNLLSLVVEAVLMKLQLAIIYRHQTKELVTKTQLWFFPNDFEKKIPILKKF
ncbi:MAG: hypothetical protein WC775_05850 [Patescibacteria group bacterium]|jgi:predicted nucleotidyltransferase